MRKSLFLLLASTQIQTAAAAGLEDAEKSYAARNYALCLKELDSIPAGSRSPKADYYRALTLQALHRKSEAMQLFSALAAQKKDSRIANLSKQGYFSLLKNTGSESRQINQSKISSVQGNTSATNPKYYTDNTWKIQKPGFGGQGINRDSLPENWTFVKTSEGCGRH
ncbi:MAG: hypothetical protein K2X27_28420 [Candidatus Obscuribacterales bacterium]|nr:hypothetical protein [Candidatus Obscuribacterales bacterium]